MRGKQEPIPRVAVDEGPDARVQSQEIDVPGAARHVLIIRFKRRHEGHNVLPNRWQATCLTPRYLGKIIALI